MSKTPSPVPDATIQAIQTLGFSELEASIYAFLLVESPTTGYRIAQALGKPVANTYNGIQSLQSKGAILVEDSDTRLCRAVPPDEMMGQMERAFQERRKLVSEALATLRAAPEDARVYKLSTPAQVLERSRQMIRNSGQVVLVCAFPEPLSAIKEELEQAAERGVGVMVKAYLPIEIRGASLTLSTETDFFLDGFPAQELTLVADAEQHLIAMLDKEMKQVLQAIWSSSLILSFSHYNNLYNEWILTRLSGLIGENSSLDRLKESLQRAHPLTQTPGYHKLMAGIQEKENR
jgi:HTH-type transcriptional regulator, sugar sensing transcriptional regulator